MLTLRKFFIGLLALTALVVAAYVVYEMTPERRARRIVAKLRRLLDESFVEYPEEEKSLDYVLKRMSECEEELLEITCRCEPPINKVRDHLVHKEGCLYSELIKKLDDYWWELEKKWKKEWERHALEESRR